MIAERPPRELIEAAARGRYREKFAAGRPNGTPPANSGPAIDLVGSPDKVQVVGYRGVAYTLGFVSFVDGIRLQRAWVAIRGMSEEATAENELAYLEALLVVVALAPRYLVPVHRGRRLFRWLFRNPFRKATDAEVGLLLGFFLQSRMRSRVRTSAGANPLRLPTS